MSSSKTQVLTIRAGPGGLVLAHALQKNDISFEIFERDSIDHVHPQGWAVALHDCIGPLRATISEAVKDIQTISVNAPLGIYDSIAVVDPSGSPMPGRGGVPEGEPGHILRVRRERLREYLWKGIPVQRGKHFSHYHEGDAGVTAYFADGTSASGNILVGADGAHSHVRTQLLGMNACAAPYIPVLGSGVFPKDVYEPIHNTDSAADALGGEGLRVIISMLSINCDQSLASYYWAAFFLSKEPKKNNLWAAEASKEELVCRFLTMI